MSLIRCTVGNLHTVEPVRYHVELINAKLRPEVYVYWWIWKFYMRNVIKMLNGKFMMHQNWVIGCITLMLPGSTPILCSIMTEMNLMKIVQGNDLVHRFVSIHITAE